MDVMIELHGLWNVPMAQRIIRALEEYQPRWIETRFGHTHSMPWAASLIHVGADRRG